MGLTLGSSPKIKGLVIYDRPLDQFWFHEWNSLDASKEALAQRSEVHAFTIGGMGFDTYMLQQDVTRTLQRNDGDELILQSDLDTNYDFVTGQSTIKTNY